MQSFQLQERGTPVQATSYKIEDWQGGYKSVREELDYYIDNVEGRIPPDLQGTLFRNGPGLLDINGQRIHHPFDGDGMIVRVSFNDGRAHFSNRFVRTQGFLEEQAAGKILYRGVFGTQKPGGVLANAFDLRLKNIANTNVIYWGGKLLALWEAAEPHRLDPYTLETLGLDYLDGSLQPGEAFGAHPRIDPSCVRDGGDPCLVNFAIKPGLSSTITLFELDLSGRVARRYAHSVPGFAFIHDFAITPNYCIFFQNPVSFNPLPFALGWRGAGECVQFRPDQPTSIVVIPRHANAGRQMQILESMSGFVFHHANAFEQGDGIICMDSICYQSLPAVEPESDFRQVKFEGISPGQLWRFVLNLNTKTVHRELIESRCCEFPSLHPAKVGRQHRYLYIGAAHAATGNAPLQAILKLDLETGTRQLWSAAPGGFMGEPVFVSRPGATREDDGWVIALVYDSTNHRSDVVILDARDLNREPVARLHLKQHIPYGLHGNWTSQYFTSGSNP
jgi:all-trans-8'-apo-beta-carotenal 15,15'-oxygenase